MGQLTAFRGIYASKVSTQQNETKITPESFRVFIDVNQTASSNKKQFHYNIHIIAFCYFW